MASEEYNWHKVCEVGDIDEEDVIEIELNAKVYALYFTLDTYYATDGRCTHEQACLADGLVSGDMIECPKHNARFHIPSGKATRRPALVDLETYPVKKEGDDLLIGLAPTM